MAVLMSSPSTAWAAAGGGCGGDDVGRGVDGDDGLDVNGSGDGRHKGDVRGPGIDGRRLQAINVMQGTTTKTTHVPTHLHPPHPHTPKLPTHPGTYPQSVATYIKHHSPAPQPTQIYSFILFCLTLTFTRC